MNIEVKVEGASPEQALAAVQKEGEPTIYSVTEMARLRAEEQEQTGYACGGGWADSPPAAQPRYGCRIYSDFTGADPRFRNEQYARQQKSANSIAFDPVRGEIQLKLSDDTVPSYDEQREDQIARGVAMRFNAGKLRYDLLPPDALEELVAIYTMGAAKYADRNWERGFDWMSCYASLQRHANLWAKGEDRDDESGRLHMGHVAWNAMALAAFALRAVGKDDRPRI